MEKGNKFYASVVESIREGSKVAQNTILYLDEVKENQIPYLKAAYSSDKPKLLYKDDKICE